ncbi:signal peptidase I isoform X2 [Anopheles bellator]|uniref:signal peptidase I isoform X2 n=1 Tax=Anopheles bellator TaxID=139047 RepID=UPI002649F135|nr:signal peptidase I isoform X2 [Anopheles bellator]
MAALRIAPSSTSVTSSSSKKCFHLIFQCVGPSMEPTLTTNNVLITDRITPRLSKLKRGDIIITKSPTNPVQHVCKRIIGMPGDRIMTRASFNLNPLSNTYTIYTSVVASETTTAQQTPSSAHKPLHVPAAKLRQKVDYVSSSIDETRSTSQPTTNAVHSNRPDEANEGEATVEMMDELGTRVEPRPSIVTVPRGHLWIEGDNVQNSSDSRNYGPVPIGLVKSRAICRLWPLNEFKLFI